MSEEISWLDLLHSWHPITVPCWNSLSSWERPILSKMFVETVFMPRCLLLFTCGHWSDWNTWFQLFGWVSESFWQYSVCQHLLYEMAPTVADICCPQRMYRICITLVMSWRLWWSSDFDLVPPACQSFVSSNNSTLDCFQRVYRHLWFKEDGSYQWWCFTDLSSRWFKQSSQSPPGTKLRLVPVFISLIRSKCKFLKHFDLWPNICKTETWF